MSVVDTIEGLEGFQHPQARNGSLEANMYIDDFLDRAGVEITHLQSPAVIEYKNLTTLLPTSLWVSDGSVFMVTVGTGDDTSGFDAVFIRKRSGEILRRTSRCSKSTFSTGGFGNYAEMNDGEDLMQLLASLAGEGPVEVHTDISSRLRELFPETLQEKLRRIGRNLMKFGKA